MDAEVQWGRKDGSVAARRPRVRRRASGGMRRQGDAAAAVTSERDVSGDVGERGGSTAGGCNSGEIRQRQ